MQSCLCSRSSYSREQQAAHASPAPHNLSRRTQLPHRRYLPRPTQITVVPPTCSLLEPMCSRPATPRSAIFSTSCTGQVQSAAHNGEGPGSRSQACKQAGRQLLCNDRCCRLTPMHTSWQDLLLSTTAANCIRPRPHLISNQDVCGLDVAVDDAGSMQVLQSQCNLRLAVCRGWQECQAHGKAGGVRQCDRLQRERHFPAACTAQQGTAVNTAAQPLACNR